MVLLTLIPVGLPASCNVVVLYTAFYKNVARIVTNITGGTSYVIPTTVQLLTRAVLVETSSVTIEKHADVRSWLEKTMEANIIA